MIGYMNIYNIAWSLSGYEKLKSSANTAHDGNNACAPIGYALRCSCIIIQWNLRIKNKLVDRPMCTIRRLSFVG